MSRPNLYKIMSGNAENARLSTLVKLANTLQTSPQLLLQQMFEQSNFPAPVSSSPIHKYDATGFIADVTIPDNSKVKPRQKFIKTWKIQNVGNLTWSNRFLTCIDQHIKISSHHDAFEPPIERSGLIPTQNKIAIDKLMPGETTEISVEFTSPSLPGSCLSYWKMCDTEGNFLFPKLEGLSCQVQVLCF